jgi:flagellar biosynthesis protein FliP
MFRIFAIVLLTAYLVGMVVFSATMVGNMPTGLEPYSASLPFKMFVFLIIPAILGYEIGKGGK